MQKTLERIDRRYNEVFYATELQDRKRRLKRLKILFEHVYYLRGESTLNMIRTGSERPDDRIAELHYK